MRRVLSDTDPRKAEVWLAVPAKVKEQAVGVAWMLLTYMAIIVNEFVNIYNHMNHSNIKLGRTETSTYV